MKSVISMAPILALSACLCTRVMAVEPRYIENFPPGHHLPATVPAAATRTSAPATPPVTVQLTLPQAVGKAVANNPTIKAAGWGIRMADRDVDRALAARLPVLRFNAVGKDSNFGDRWLLLGEIGKTLSNINADSAGIWGVGMEVPVYVGGKLSAGERLARIGRRAAELQKKLSIQQSIYNVIIAYLDILVHGNEVKLEDRKFKQKMQSIATIKAKATERFALKQQVLALELEANDVRQDRLEASNKLRIARNRLLNEVGLPSNTPVDIDPRVGIEEPPNDLETLVGRARRNNLQLQLLLADIEAAKERVGLSAADEKAQISLAWDYYHTHPFAADNDDYETWEVKLQGRINIFDGGRARQKRLKALDELRRKELELTAARQEIELKVRGAYARYEEARRLLSSLDDNIRLAREMLRFVEERVAAKVLLKDALLKAQVDLLEAQQAKFFVNATVLKARAALLLLAGELTPDKVAGPGLP